MPKKFFALPIPNNFYHTKRIETQPNNIERDHYTWIEVNLMEEKFGNITKLLGDVIFQNGYPTEIAGISKNYIALSIDPSILLFDKNLGLYISAIPVRRDMPITQLKFLNDEEFLTASYRNSIKNNSFRIQLWTSKKKSNEKLQSK